MPRPSLPHPLPRRAPTWRGTGLVWVALLTSACATPSVATLTAASTQPTAAPVTATPVPATIPPAAPTATTATATSSIAPSASGHGAALCHLSDLTLTLNGPVSPATGEHGSFYALTNTSSSTCSIAGYPRITLTDAAGMALPFTYTHSGQYLDGTAAPHSVLLAPAAAGYVLISKYRCDLAGTIVPAALHLWLSDQAASTSSPLTTTQAVSKLDYCTASPHDPGNTVEVSAVLTTPTR